MFLTGNAGRGVSSALLLQGQHAGHGRRSSVMDLVQMLHTIASTGLGFFRAERHASIRFIRRLFSPVLPINRRSQRLRREQPIAFSSRVARERLAIPHRTVLPGHHPPVAYRSEAGSDRTRLCTAGNFPAWVVTLQDSRSRFLFDDRWGHSQRCHS